jgi:hypothetical protein
MLFNEDSKGITYTSDGDFMINPTSGSLMQSHMDDMSLLGETIYRRLNAVNGDWSSQFAISSNLREVVGLEMNGSNMDFIAFLIRNALTIDNLIKNNEIAITPGVSIDTKVSLSVSIKAEPLKEEVLLGLIYDTRDNNFEVKFLNQKAYKK